MAFLNKLKELKGKAVEVTANTTQKVKDNYEQMKVEQAEKRAIAEAYDKEMKEKVNILAQELKKSIEKQYNENSQSFFSSISEERLISFTKEFYEKILLPANSVSRSGITMYPYTEENKIKNIKKNIPQIGSDETIIIHFKDSFNQEFVFTTKNFYFKVSHNDDKKYYAIDSIPYSKINKFEVIKEENYYLKCNNFNLAYLEDVNIYEQDYITLNDYFRCIDENDFEITDEEIDKIIQEKIGHKIYQQIKKYMIYDDEYAIYFAWGLDSITAKDYIVCTTKQIIIMDREILGATSNVKQFYYEDITSMSTLQNSNGLLDIAFSAMFKQCDLEINVAGASETINTLNKVEAQRVIAIYHEYRKMIKSNNNQPKIIIQQEEKKDDVFEQIEKLAKLKEMGILTEEEFNTKKMDLLQKI